METLALALASVGAAIIAALAAIVIFRMLTGTIDLSELLSDRPEASLSRFQFLVFTFVIGLSYLLLVIADLARNQIGILPDVPGGALALLGISGGGYVLGKGIEKTAAVSAHRSATIAAAAAARSGGGAPPAPPPAPPPGDARP